jgi:hypothetical protein
LAREVGLPIDPPQRNFNSRFALETAELVRAQKGDDAERLRISASDVEAAWQDRRFSPTVDAFIKEAHIAGATGVPAMGWPHRRAIVGMMPAAELVLRLSMPQ